MINFTADISFAESIVHLALSRVEDAPETIPAWVMAAVFLAIQSGKLQGAENPKLAPSFEEVARLGLMVEAGTTEI